MQRPNIETIIYGEASRFVRKDPSKLPLVLSLYASSLVGRKAGQITRAAYFCLRHLDDVLDGEMDERSADQAAWQEPVSYAQSVREQIATGQFNSSTKISRLARYSTEGLVNRARQGDDPRRDMTTIIDTMIFDHIRRQERDTTNRAELDKYYRDTFGSIIDVTLIGLGSPARSRQFPDFGPSQGRLYSVRDIGKDWDLGIINIPAETLTTAGVSPFDPIETVTENEAIQSWASDEIRAGRAGMRGSLDAIADVDDRIARVMLGGLGRGAMRGPFPPELYQEQTQLP